MIKLLNFITVKKDITKRSITLKVFEQTYELEFNSDHQFQQALSTLNNLGTGVTSTEGASNELMELLETESLIYRFEEKHPHAKSGLEFYCELFHRINNGAFLEKGQTKLAKALENPDKNTSLLYGFTLEYFHVTRRAIQCLAPILKHNLPYKVRQLATEFIKDELFHENIMARSFIDIDGRDFNVDETMPLPTTEAYMDHLYDMARHRPNSFFSSLFIYEGDDDDLAFYANAISTDPAIKNLKDSHVAHANINIEGGHTDISKEYFKRIDSITTADQVQVIDDCEYLIHLYYAMQDEIFEVYQTKFEDEVTS